MTNKPTTGEIVDCLKKAVKIKSGVSSLVVIDEVWHRQAADRLESQERENASLRAENKGLHKEIIRRGIEIKTMTARAESAEKWATAAIADIERLRLRKFLLCPICEFEDIIGCAHKNHCIGYQQFKWRGLQPQDGGGNER